MSVWSLLPYQRRWVEDPAPVKICVKSRRIGVSWADAFDSVSHAAADGGDTVYISYAREMTQTYIGDCRQWAEDAHRLALHIDETLLDPDDPERPTRYRLALPGGRTTEGLPSTPHSLRSRGRPGDRVVIDEAAFVRSVDDLLGAGMAVRIWGGAVRVISTHNGADNGFARLLDEAARGELPYSVHTVTLADAVADGLYRRIVAVRARAAARIRAAGGTPDETDTVWSPEGEAAWVAGIRASYRYPWQAAEELDCIPASGGGAWIGIDEYVRAEHAGAGDPERYAGGAVHVGYDVARRQDLAVLAVLERVGDVLWTRELVVMRGWTFGAQRDEVARILRDYRVVRVAVDQTGMGEAQVEALQDRHGRLRIEGVLLTSDRRLTVATALRDAFESARIRVPRDPELRLDVRSVRRAPSATGAPRLYSEDATPGGRKAVGHADRFWALALAAASAGSGEARYAAHRIDNHRDGSRDARQCGRPGRTWRWRSQRGGLA